MKNSTFLVIVFHFLFFSTLVAQTSDSSITEQGEVYYVIFDRDTLWEVKEDIGPFLARDRANALNKRLKYLKRNERLFADSFYIAEIDSFMVISYRSQPIFYVSEGDARSKGKDRQVLASELVDILKSSMIKVLKRRTASFWLIRIGFTLLAILGLVIIYYGIIRLFKWIDQKLTRYEKSIKRKRKNFLRYLFPGQPQNALLFLSRILRNALLIVVIIIYLPLLLGFMPWTENLATQFYAFLAKPVRDILTGILNFLPKLLYIFVILLISRYVIRVFTYITREIEKDKLLIKGFHREWARPTYNIIRIILYAFTLVFIFPYLPGSNSPAFKGVSIFLGVLFSLGSTSAIANIVSGIVITYMRPYRIGDRVKIGESVGEIIEKNLLVTRIRTLKNVDITIPNATIINSHLWNYSKYAGEMGLILHPSITIGYDVPWEQVNSLLLKAADNTKNLTREFKPFVLQKSLNDFHVEYELNVFIKQVKKMVQIESDLNKCIMDEFNKAGVEILSPHYGAFRDGNASTIPGEPAPADNPVEKIIDTITGKK